MLRLALTFDDGPGPSTGPLLDVLARHGVHATFFVVGKNLRGAALDGDTEAARQLAVRAVREGHTLGNHTDSHTRDPVLASVLSEEIRIVDAVIRDAYVKAGREPPAHIPFRLPYGPLVRDGGMLDERFSAIAAMGRTHQHWTGIFGDWQVGTDATALSESMVEHVTGVWGQGLVPVLALHDSGTRRRENGFDRSATVAAVDRLCSVVEQQGARFVTLPEIGTYTSLPAAGTASAVR